MAFAMGIGMAHMPQEAVFPVGLFAVGPLVMIVSILRIELFVGLDVALCCTTRGPYSLVVAEVYGIVHASTGVNAETTFSINQYRGAIRRGVLIVFK